MKVIIAGPRDLFDYKLVEQAVQLSQFEITEVVSGGAPGVDTNGEKWASIHKVPIKRFPADWAKHGRAAGPIRNQEMAMYAGALIAIYTGSPGTKNMINQAKARDLKMFIMSPDGLPIAM